MQTWKNGKKEIIEYKNIIKILQQVSKYKDHKIIVGTDSVKLGYNFVFTSAICVLNDNNFYDRRYFYCRQSLLDDSYLDLSKRLLKETSDSIDLAMKIRECITLANIEIHADVNSDFSHKSSKYNNMLKGYISGCGFSVKTKPQSFVASSIADLHTRKK